MIVELTKEASSCAFWMVCQPSQFWTPDKWLQAKSPTDAKETAQLYRWVDEHCREPELDEKGNKREQRKFLAFKYPIPTLIARKLKDHVEHYRTTVANQKHVHIISGQPVGLEGLNPVGFADLLAALDGSPAPKADDGLEAEDLAFLAAEKAKANAVIPPVQ